MDIAKETNKIIANKVLWTPKTLKANTILLQQNSETTHSYYLKSGIIKVYNDEKGEESTINLLSDKMFLPFDNFYNKISFVNMVTLERTELYSISNAHYKQLRANNPVFNQIVEQGLCDMMNSIIYRTLVLLGRDVAERYKTALEYFPCLQRMSNIEVAYFINSTAERLGKIKPIVLKEITEERRRKGKSGNIST